MSWNEYLSNTKSYPSRPLLQEALLFVKTRKTALDLGAGALNDARLLISNGFKVIVVDSNPQIAELARELSKDFIEINISPFDTFNFPENSFDLVNAQYALPFNKPETFSKVFEKITMSLKVGGIFTGQFFGPEDEWANSHTEMSFHSKEQVLTFLNPYTIKKFTEEKSMRPTAAGTEKHWHVFHVIAQKN